MGLEIFRSWRKRIANDAEPTQELQQNATNGIVQRLIAGAASVIPQVIKGAVGQSANLLEIQASTGTIRLKVTNNVTLLTQDSSAVLLVALNTDQGSPPEQFYVSPYATTVIGATIKGRASQSADLQQWQNSGGTALAKVLASGELVSTVAIRTKHEAAATPSGGASGDIRVGDGKIWVNDAGTWKSVAIA